MWYLFHPAVTKVVVWNYIGLQTNGLNNMEIFDLIFGTTYTLKKTYLPALKLYPKLIY